MEEKGEGSLPEREEGEKKGRKGHLDLPLRTKRTYTAHVQITQSGTVPLLPLLSPNEPKPEFQAGKSEEEEEEAGQSSQGEEGRRGGGVSSRIPI